MSDLIVHIRERNGGITNRWALGGTAMVGPQRVFAG